MITNQEAIRLIRNLPTMCEFTDAYGEQIDSDAYYEAADMAISALQEQELSELKNNMDKKEILDGLYEIKNWKCGGDAKMHTVIEAAIKALEAQFEAPSVQSKKFSEVLRGMMEEDYYLFCHTGYSRLAEKDWEWLIEQVKEMEQSEKEN